MYMLCIGEIKNSPEHVNIQRSFIKTTNLNVTVDYLFIKSESLCL